MVLVGAVLAVLWSVRIIQFKIIKLMTSVFLLKQNAKIPERTRQLLICIDVTSKTMGYIYEELF